MALDGIAAQVASAIRNARLFEEKVRALRNLEILQEITNVLNSDLDLDALLERIARRSVEAVRPAQMGAVLLYDDECAARALELRLRARRRRWPRVRLAFHEGLPGSVFVSGQGRLVALRARRLRRATAPTPSARRPAGAIARSALCVPIALPQEKLGVLLLESATAAGRLRGRRPALRGHPGRTRPPSPSATRCACAACWRWTASARTTSRTSATSCARRSP